MAFFFIPAEVSAKDYTVSSPDKHLSVTVSVTDIILYSVKCEGDVIIAPSTISMTLNSGNVLGTMASVKAVETKSHLETISTPFYRKKEALDSYNKLIIQFRGGYSLEFRAYNDAAAYRFTTEMNEELSITEEAATFNFEGNPYCRVTYSDSETSDPFQCSFESLYDYVKLSSFREGELAYLPVMVELENGYKVVITESNIESFPGMFLTADGPGFTSEHAAFPSKVRTEKGKFRQTVSARSETIAETEGVRTFPWRIIAVSKDEKSFPVSDIVYLLASPNRIGDVSWIKPGRTTWDWWSDWKIYNVDFLAGINTRTYQYFIDFAASKGLEYVILDEGWSPDGKGDVMSVVPEIDLQEIIDYAAARNVGVILWSVSYVLDAKLEEACDKYGSMGIKGFKVDFTDRNDQQAVEMLYRILQTAADHHLIIDSHGMCQPAGLNRTYPNLVNVEGVYGMEQSKRQEGDMLTYDVTFPYIRMMAGITDYSPGALHNAQGRAFMASYSYPMSQGTRAHQVAFYSILDSPLITLCDSPTDYLREAATTDFICRFPTVWDETRILDGEVGKYIVSARRNGNSWYIGGITGREKRSYKLPLSFLTDDDSHSIELFCDGLNAERTGEDFVIRNYTVTKKDTLEIEMVTGGGFAAIIQ